MCMRITVHNCRTQLQHRIVLTIYPPDNGHYTNVVYWREEEDVGLYNNIRRFVKMRCMNHHAGLNFTGCLYVGISVKVYVCKPAYIKSKSEQRTRSFRFEHSRSRAALQFWRGGKLMAQHPSYHIFFFSLSARDNVNDLCEGQRAWRSMRIWSRLCTKANTPQWQKLKAWHWFIRRT